MTGRLRGALVAALAAALLTTVARVALPTAAPASASPVQGVARDAVDTARATYEDARARVAALSEQSRRVTANAEAAETEAARLHAGLDDDDGGLVGAVGRFFSGGPSELDRAVEAAQDAEDARELADLVQRALEDQIAATEEARVAWERAERRRARLEAAYSAEEYADAVLARAHFLDGYAATGAQDLRNRQALSAWRDYLRALADAAVVPPPVDDLDDPTRLPAGLTAARDGRNQLAPGVAVVHPARRAVLPVVSTEAVRAVTEALRRVGLPEVPGAIAPTAYACGGLVANAWAGPQIALPAGAHAQVEDLRAVPTASVHPGDVVVLGTRRDGVSATGVFVGGEQLVVADPVSGVAAVQPTTGAVLAVRRVGVAGGNDRPAPTGGTCDETATSDVDASGPFVLPIAPGAYELTAGFGDGGALWSSGVHTGLDFAAPSGTPVVAVGSGTVTVEHPGWAGNLVRIDHGGGVETLYAHLSAVDVVDGQSLKPGDRIGRVGDRGNSSGPHLHLEVRLDGTAYSPALVLDVPEAPRPAHPNGELPAEALCPATSDGYHVLRCDAAVAYRLMAAAFAEQVGEDLCITDSYRSREGQERAHAAKPDLTAAPGTSVHGLGLAVDLCGGVESFGTPEHEWLVDQGAAFGWRHPGWASAGGSRPEPWHFEYSGGH